MSLTNYLAELQRLRNDPQLAANILRYAVDGNVDAQYAMGLIYAEGRGVGVDLARAHYWLSLATDQGDIDARILRNVIGAQMSEEEYQASLRMRQGPKLSLVK
ncbi:MAG: sel1 repeat family protein [Gammaproteobacteria bacterium]|nr:sel1 repeat family protein [Gammaproteobacteria bacterium]MCP5137660.1 sel1 repeat family protein [Gammaproteobacteria bacterium]